MKRAKILLLLRHDSNGPALHAGIFRVVDFEGFSELSTGAQPLTRPVDRVIRTWLRALRGTISHLSTVSDPIGERALVDVTDFGLQDN